MDSAKLAMMADQIARNFAAQGENAAVNQTAEHIRLYWESRMIDAVLISERAHLSPIAAAAIDLLAGERQT